MVTAGANMAFMHAVFAVTEPGDEIILNVRSTSTTRWRFRWRGCRAVGVATDDRYQPRIDALRAAITDRTRAIVTVSPNNPSGADVRRSRSERSASYAVSAGCFTFPTRSTSTSPTIGPPRLAGGFSGAADYTISMFSLSKAYGFAGGASATSRIPITARAMAKSQDTILVCPTWRRKWVRSRARRRPIVLRAYVAELADVRQSCVSN
jgi:aspartate/methionine/tyrosine aminotransferase